VTPALLDRPATRLGEGAGPGGRLSGGRVTLEERLNAVLHEARTNGIAECPVCHARITRSRAHTRAREDETALGADCHSCGSRLS
jgi:hypothetical protein